MRSRDTELVRFVVRADPGTLYRSAKGSITGVVYIELGERAFPEPGWRDVTDSMKWPARIASEVTCSSLT